MDGSAMGEVAAISGPAISGEFEEQLVNPVHHRFHSSLPPTLVASRSLIPPATALQVPNSSLQSTSMPNLTGLLNSGVPGTGLNPSTTALRYAQLLMVIEEMSADIRPTYSGSKSAAERLKRGLNHAKLLVKECLNESDNNSQQFSRN